MRDSPEADLLEQLIVEHADALRAFAVRRVGVDSADDVVAEVFATAWRRRRDIPPEPRPWLYGIARNEILHSARGMARSRRLVARLKAQPAPAPALATEYADAESLLKQLDPMDAEVLRLTAWEQLTPAEIASVLTISPGAARMRLHRARNRAQSLLDQAAETTPILPLTEARS